MSTLRTISFLAVKDLNRDKRIAALVVCVIAFSFVNITFFSSFMTGLGNTFTDAIINTATSHVYITPSEVTEPKYIDNVASLRKKIELNTEVVASTARLNVPVTIKYKDKEISVQAIGAMPSDEIRVTEVANYITDGAFLTDGSNDDILLGRFIAGERIEDTLGQESFGALSRGLGVGVGDIVTVKYQNGVERQYRVRGILSSFGVAQVGQQAYLTYDEAESVLGLDNEASAILVKIQDKNRAEEVKRFIIEQGVRSVEVRTWIEASSFVGAITSTFGIVTLMSTMVGVIVVVVTIGIVVFINTARKKRIIGVLKAIGMNSNQIMYIFLFQSILLGALGTALGTVMYLSASYLTYLNPIQLAIGPLILYLPPEAIYSVAITILIASLVAGYIPARMASKAKILENIKTVE